MLRVYIADDSVAFGTLAAAWLDSFPDFEVVGAVRSAPEAIAGLAEAAPDVLILDRLLPQPEQSEEVLTHVRRALPGTAVVFISGMPDDHLAEEAAAAGADGHVSKAANAEALAHAVRRAAAARRERHPA